MTQILYEVFQKIKGERKLPNSHWHLVGGGQTDPRAASWGVVKAVSFSPDLKAKLLSSWSQLQTLSTADSRHKDYFFCVIMSSWVLRNWGYAEHTWGRQLFAACDFITENMERVNKLGQVTTAGWGLNLLDLVSSLIQRTHL